MFAMGFIMEKKPMSTDRVWAIDYPSIIPLDSSMRMRQYKTLREAEGYLDSTLAFARLGVSLWIGFGHWMQRARMLRCVSPKSAKTRTFD